MGFVNFVQALMVPFNGPLLPAVKLRATAIFISSSAATSLEFIVFTLPQ